MIYLAAILCIIALLAIWEYERAAKALGTSHAHERRQLLARLDMEQTILDSMGDPVLLLDKTRRIVRANRGALNFLGSDIVGRDVMTVLSAADVQTALENTLQTGAINKLEYVQQQPVLRNYRVSITPFHKFVMPVEADADVRLEWPDAIILMTEITDMKRSEEMRIDFVANVSHELRTPLATLMGFIETIRGPAREEKETVDKFLGIMQEQVRRMSSLVTDLLALSRAELQEHEQPTEHVNLNKLLNHVWAAMELRSADKGMMLKVEAPRDLPEVQGDWDQLVQTLVNLIENAIKYGPENSEITVTARAEDKNVAIAVKDQGQGIPLDILDNLTRRFYRAEDAKARRIQGTGLGLAIVKHIVARHRGRLEITSEMGHGSTFTVWLPVVQ